MLGLRRQPGRLAALTGPLGRRVRARRRVLVVTAADGVTNPRVFGSVARGEDQQAAMSTSWPICRRR